MEVVKKLLWPTGSAGKNGSQGRQRACCRDSGMVDWLDTGVGKRLSGHCFAQGEEGRLNWWGSTWATFYIVIYYPSPVSVPFSECFSKGCQGNFRSTFLGTAPELRFG